MKSDNDFGRLEPTSDVTGIVVVVLVELTEDDTVALTDSVADVVGGRDLRCGWADLDRR